MFSPRVAGGWARCITKVMRELLTPTRTVAGRVMAAATPPKALPGSNGRVGIAGFLQGGQFAWVMSPKGFDALLRRSTVRPLPRELCETLDGACTSRSFGSRDVGHRRAQEEAAAGSRPQGSPTTVRPIEVGQSFRQQASRPDR